MSIRNNKGQPILEYTLVLAAVIAVIVLVLFGPSGIRDRIQGAYNATGDALQNTTNDLRHGIFE